VPVIDVGASLGHAVEEADPKLDMVALRPMNARISAANTARSCNMRWKALGREPNAGDVEAVTWAVYQRGLKVSGIEYIEAIAAAHAAGRKMGAFLTSYDVILSTMLAGPPPKLGYFDQNGDVQTFVERVTEYLSVTPLHNATGTPAMSVPLHADRQAICRPMPGGAANAFVFRSVCRDFRARKQMGAR
jgi:amidase